MNTLNSAGESNSDESIDQMEVMEKIIESDEDEISSPENFAKPRLMSNQIFTSDSKVKARIFKYLHQQFLSSITYSIYIL